MVSSSSSNRKLTSRNRRAPFLRKRSLVGGRYAVLKQLSEGAFGHTLLAEDTHLPGKPKCVLKQLKPQVGHRAMQTSRRLFEQEAQVLYELGNHHQIPQLLAHFEHRDVFYLAQEYIEGRSISQELKMSMPCSESQVIQLIREILEVLVFVHQQQVIHRDLKPANLLRRKGDGKIVMIDFGAVKQVGSQFLNPAPGETDYTIAIGTVGYIPNEQLGGRPRYSSDIYAVGMIGIQALTGLAPTELDDDDRTGEILWRDCVPHVSPTFAAILSRMVAYDFRERYTTAAEALDVFKKMEMGTPLSIVPPVISSPNAASPARPPTTLSLPPTEHHSREFPAGTDGKIAEAKGPASSSNLSNSHFPSSNNLGSNLPEEKENERSEASGLLPKRLSQIPLDSPWISPVDSAAYDWSQPPSSLMGQLTRFQQECYDQGMGLAVRLWQQRYRFNPWYAIAIAAVVGTFSVVERESWRSEQRNRIYSANTVPPQTVLEPANRLVKNLPDDLDDEIWENQLEDQLDVKISDYMATAEASIDDGDVQAALGAYETVLTLDDGNVQALTQRCTILSDLDDPPAALSACQELEIASPKDVVALWGLGKANYNMAQYEEALDYFDQALAIVPGYGPAWNGRKAVFQAMQNQ